MAPAGHPDADGRPPRLGHEFDRRRRDVHPGRHAHRQPEPRRPAPAHDADGLRGADQRHADAGRHLAQSGHQLRADRQRGGRLQFLLLHAVRHPHPAGEHSLHEFRAALAGHGNSGRCPGAGPAENEKMGQALPACRSRISGQRAARFAPVGKNTRRSGPDKPDRRADHSDRARGRPHPATAGAHPGHHPPGRGRAAARPRSADRRRGGAVRTVQGRPVAEFGTLFHRPFAGCRPGRGDSPGRLPLRAQNGRRGRTSRPLRADGGRRPPRQGGARTVQPAPDRC